MHVRDANSRDIFKNNILASKFLKNYTGIPIFADIVPEDVEDVTGKFRAFLGIEYESDAVKKVYIRKKDGSLEKEVYVVSLIEHKRAVDYDVAMQLLHYMCAIWQEHKVAQNKIQEGVSRKKEFRYPLIIPIVYQLRRFFPEEFPYIYVAMLAVIAFLFVFDFKVFKPDKKCMLAFVVIGALIAVKMFLL